MNDGIHLWEHLGAEGEPAVRAQLEEVRLALRALKELFKQGGGTIWKFPYHSLEARIRSETLATVVVFLGSGVELATDTVGMDDVISSFAEEFVGLDLDTRLIAEMEEAYSNPLSTELTDNFLNRMKRLGRGTFAATVNNAPGALT